MTDPRSGETWTTRWHVYLRLGRVSNLPTIWTNVLAGIALAGGAADTVTIASLLTALSCFYVGGMFLNDAFDAAVDRVRRPDRPIPAKHIGVREVWIVGAMLLALGEGLLTMPALLNGTLHHWEALGWGLALIALILYYNARHTRDPFSPLIMACCRAMVYCISAAVVSSAFSLDVLIGAGTLGAYIVGLTAIARHEHVNTIQSMWPLGLLGAPFIYASSLIPHFDLYSLIYAIFLGWVIYATSFLVRPQARNIPRTVVCLIAGIALLDAVVIAKEGADPLWVGAAVAGFAVTWLGQRYISGT